MLKCDGFNSLKVRYKTKFHRLGRENNVIQVEYQGKRVMYELKSNIRKLSDLK